MIKRAQTLLEYSLLLAIIVAALLTMQLYMKRGIQGRWKQAIDDVGEQYDVESFHGDLRWTLNSISRSQLIVQPFHPSPGVTNGMMTFRNDTAYSIDKKEGSTTMGFGQL